MLEATFCLGVFLATVLTSLTVLTATRTSVFIAPEMWSANLTLHSEWSLFHCANPSYSTFNEEMAIICIYNCYNTTGRISPPKAFYFFLKDENTRPSTGLVCSNMLKCDHILQFLVAGLFSTK